MLFLNKESLQLINGGYLASGDESPVTHVEFVQAQVKAHYLVTLSEKVSKANFEVKTPDSFASIVESVKADLKDSDYVYADTPTKPVRKITDALKSEAMSWIDFQGETETVKRINMMMQEFNIVKDFEEFGLYFQEGLVKLKAIYNISDIVKAITVLEKHLD